MSKIFEQLDKLYEFIDSHRSIGDSELAIIQFKIDIIKDTIKRRENDRTDIK